MSSYILEQVQVIGFWLMVLACYPWPLIFVVQVWSKEIGEATGVLLSMLLFILMLPFLATLHLLQKYYEWRRPIPSPPVRLGPVGHCRRGDRWQQGWDPW